MAERISIACPACSARLSLSDYRALGRRIECPNCSTAFVAQATGASGQSSVGVFKFGLILGTVLLALISSVLGMFYSGVFEKAQPALIAAPEVESVAAPIATDDSTDSTENTLALRWMPAETEALLHVKVANLAQTPLLKGLFESQQVTDAVDGFQKATGLPLQEIESINIGTSDLNRLQTLAMAQYMGFRGPAFPPKTVIVIRSNKPVSTTDLSKSLPDHESAERNGKSYLKSLNPAAPSVWIADPVTILVGLSDEMNTILDWGETSDPRKELKVVDSTSHLLLVVAPKAPDEWVDSVTPKSNTNTSGEVADMQKSLTDSFTAFGLTLNVRGGFDVMTRIALENPGAAAKVEAGLKKILADVTIQFERYKSTAPSAIAELGEALLQNLKIETIEQAISLSSNIPDSAQSQLEQLPPLLMLMSLPRLPDQPRRSPEVQRSKK